MSGLLRHSCFGRFMPGAFDELTSTAPMFTAESRESRESRESEEQALLTQWQDMM